MLINGMVTTMLSESLFHVMLGCGVPLAKQFSVTFCPSVTVFPVISVMLGGTAKVKVKVFPQFSLTSEMSCLPASWSCLSKYFELVKKQKQKRKKKEENTRCSRQNFGQKIVKKIDNF